MNKEELVEAVAKKTKLTKKDVYASLDATLDSIAAALKRVTR